MSGGSSTTGEPTDKSSSELVVDDETRNLTGVFLTLREPTEPFEHWERRFPAVGFSTHANLVGFHHLDIRN